MKKIFALLLSGVILASSTPLSSFAASDSATNEIALKPNSNAYLEELGEVVYDAVPISIREDKPMGASNDPSKEALESAIKAVKAKITIPKEYSEFDYYFYNTDSYADSYWRLSWSKPDTGSRIQVSCDQNNHITNYSKYDYDDKNNSIPTYLKKELKSTADAFIKKIAPSVYSKLEYVEATYEGIYSGNYKYNYRRIENSVIFPDNTVTVSVNSVTGEVKSASINWLYGTNIPSASTILTKEEATKLLKEYMQMNLVYRTDYYRIYEGDKKVQKAYLVYEPSESYISIDAKTGKVNLTRNEWVETPSYKEDEKSSADVAGNGSDSDAGMALTEEEIAKIEELKNLISKDEAIKAVTGNQYLYLDKNLKAYSATLNKSYVESGEDNYVWNVQLSDPREIDYNKEKDYYRAYASAQVDAKTGKILSFYASIKNQYDESKDTWNKVDIPYDREEGLVILEKFLNSQAKTRFKNSKLVDQNFDYIAYYKNENPVYGGYYYRYNRVNEGVEFPYNGINGSVDGITGKIYSYHCNWNDSVVFESTNGTMSADEAMDQYLSKEGYGLKYEINMINRYDPNVQKNDTFVDYNNAYSIEYEVRLVYRPDIIPYFISPFTGEQLDYNGKVYQETKPYVYQDIADTKENREILLLADMNVGFEGEYFNPSRSITKGEFDDLMQKVGIGYGYNDEETKNANQNITKEELAQSFIEILRLEKISELKGIYQTGYADEYNINQKYIGSVALAKALGLLEGDGNNYFNPKNKITRAEAVHLILNFIDVQREGVLY